MTAQGTTNPLSTYGVWTLVVAIMLLLGGGIAGLLAASEFSRWASLAGSNPFAGVAGNSAVYLLGIACTALLSGVGLLIVAIAFLSGRVAAVAR
jgi:hypothetical protein